MLYNIYFFFYRFLMIYFIHLLKPMMFLMFLPIPLQQYLKESKLMIHYLMNFLSFQLLEKKVLYVIHSVKLLSCVLLVVPVLMNITIACPVVITQKQIMMQYVKIIQICFRMELEFLFVACHFFYCFLHSGDIGNLAMKFI